MPREYQFSGEYIYRVTFIFINKSIHVLVIQTSCKEDAYEKALELTTEHGNHSADIIQTQVEKLYPHLFMI